MTSGNFAVIPVNSITVPDERQRKDFSDIESLAESIRQRGLIHPIVVQREGLILIAGERRLRAHKHLGFDNITVQFSDELDPTQLQLIELEENVKRRDLTWQEQNDAIVSFHQLSLSINPQWNMTRTAESLGAAKASISDALIIKRMRDENVPEVAKAPTYTNALNFARRKIERQRMSEKHDIVKAVADIAAPIVPKKQEEKEEPDRRAYIVQANFLEWAKKPHAPAYNLIHCDFPYGILATKSGQSAAKNLGGYDDAPDVYWKLLHTFVQEQDNFVASSAHMVFWFSMNYYGETRDILQNLGGWKVDPFPLIWHRSDGLGMLPDHNRGPRRTYETAFFCTRGDRPIVRAVNNSYSGSTTKEYHMSEKPHGMLTHFLRMLVDDSTRMLDPTCGGGMAVRVAEELGAKISAGLELNPEYVAEAKRNLNL